MSKENNIENLIGICALLVHAAKIDENYTDKEKHLISTYIKSKKKDNFVEILEKAENLESNSNQLVNFTKLIKKNSLESKTIVVKELWNLILSDNEVGQYESNLMRRICGLIYFPDKLSGEIKLSLKKDKL